MNEWKKILIIFIIAVILFGAGMGTTALIYRTSLKDYQATITDITGRNAELTKENSRLIDSDIRSGEIIDRLKKSSKARLGRIQQLESGIGNIKGIVGELQSIFNTAEERLRNIIETIQQLITAVEDL